MAKKNISKKPVVKIIKESNRSKPSNAVGKASNTGKFAAELSPRVKPKTNK